MNNKSQDKKTVDMNEIRRLQKAAREGDKKHLVEWFMQFEDQVRMEYERAFQSEVGDAITNFCIAIAYTLHFNEKTKFGNKRIKDFMNDLFVTVEFFKLGEYSPEEYKAELEKEGIDLFKERE